MVIGALSRLSYSPTVGAFRRTAQYTKTFVGNGPKACRPGGIFPMGGAVATDITIKTAVGYFRVSTAGQAG